MSENGRKLVVQNRLIEANSPVFLDLAAAPFMLTEADQQQLSANGLSAHLAIARIVVNQAINAAYADGMDRRDGQLWAGWQEVLSGTETAFDLTWAQVEWLVGILSRDDLKLPPGMAQWREALIAYLGDENHKVRRQTLKSAASQGE